MSEKIHPLRKYMRPDVKKTTFCPGCGTGIITQALLRAIDELGINMDDCVFVSGIGCSAWIPSPLINADILHTTHGRPIAFASGVKLGLPDKKVIVVSGDGDLSAIGGNHLIHAARRNINMTVILVNNGIYGMTGGQTAPTTPHGHDHHDQPLRHQRIRIRYLRAGHGGGGLLCGPLDDLSSAADDQIDQEGASRRRAFP